MLEILQSPVILPKFEQYLQTQYQIPSFQYLCSELPIPDINRYGFIDFIGIERNLSDQTITRFHCFEVKVSRQNQIQATHQLAKYKVEKILSDTPIEFPQFYFRQIMRYYNIDITDLTTRNGQDLWKKHELILDEKMISHFIEENTDNIIKSTLFTQYRTFRVNYFLQHFPEFHKFVQQIKPDMIPQFPGIDESEDIPKFKIMCYTLASGLKANINMNMADLGEIRNLETRWPRKVLNPKLKADHFGEFSQYFAESQSGMFHFQFYLGGKNKPSIFLQLPDKMYVCLVHWGYHQFSFFARVNEVIASDYKPNITSKVDPIVIDAIQLLSGQYTVVSKSPQKIEMHFQSDEYQFNIVFRPARVFMFGFEKFSNMNNIQ